MNETGTSLGVRVLHALLAALPLMLTPGLVWLLAAGWLDTDTAEAAALLVLPYLVWALLFFATGLVLALKGWALRRWLARAADISVVMILLLVVGFYLASRSGPA